MLTQVPVLKYPATPKKIVVTNQSSRGNLTVSLVDWLGNFLAINLARNKLLRSVFAKHGIINTKELLVAINVQKKSFLKQNASDSKRALGSKKQVLVIARALKKFYTIFYRLPRRNVETKYQAESLLRFAEHISSIYTFVALKLCSIYELDPDTYADSILLFLLFGKSDSKVPSQIKALLGQEADPATPDSSTAPKTKLDKLTLLDLTPKIIQKYGHEVLDRLPQMLKAFRLEILKSSQEKLTPVPPDPVRPDSMRKSKAPGINRRRRNWGETPEQRDRRIAREAKYAIIRAKEKEERNAYMKLREERNAIINANKEKRKAKVELSLVEVVKQLKAKLDPEVFTFLTLALPKVFHGQEDRKVKVKEIKALTDNLKFVDQLYKEYFSTYLRRSPDNEWQTALLESIKQPGTSDYIEPEEGKALLNKAKAELKTQISALKATLVDSRINEAQPWMVPFLGSKHASKVVLTKPEATTKVRISPGLIKHQLVLKANMGKIVKDDPTLRIALDPASAKLITLGGIANIVEEGYAGDSTAAFKDVFKLCEAYVKPLVFASTMLAGKQTNLKTSVGIVRDKRLLKLNNFSSKDVDGIVKQYKKVLNAWDVLATDVHDLTKALRKKASIETKYAVAAVDQTTLDSWSAELPSLMSGKHNLKIKIVKGWTVHVPPAVKAMIANLKAAKSTKVKVVPNVFHGTSKQTGGVILTFGFKISGTQVTARSMGNVLYLAPNIDKSAQYLKPSGGYSRKDKTRGIIFMGDALIAGKPRDKAGNLPGADGFGWTKIGRFQTEELGLVDPNKQFVIRRVYLIEIEHGSMDNIAVKTRFDPLKSIQDWIAP